MNYIYNLKYLNIDGMISYIGGIISHIGGKNTHIGGMSSNINSGMISHIRWDDFSYRTRG